MSDMFYCTKIYQVSFQKVLASVSKLWLHMAGSSHPQHFFAAGCIFADFAIAVLFHPVKKIFWDFLCILFGRFHTQISDLRAKIDFENMLKIVRKLGWTLNWSDFRIILYIFTKLIFALKFDIWVHQIICTEIVKPQAKSLD